MEKLKEKIKNKDLIELEEDWAGFLDAYEALCEKLYTKGAVSYKESPGSNAEAEALQDDLLEVKMKVDSGIKKIDNGIKDNTRLIYKNIK